MQKTSEVQVRNSVVGQTAGERGPGQALGGTWATASQFTTLTPTPLCTPIPTHRNLSSGLQLGNSRLALLGPQGVGVVERVDVIKVTYPGRQK